MSTIEPVRKLGRYELLKRIAKGGMGEIYLARTRGAAGFEKNVILKTILPHLAEEEEFVTKFLDEGHIVVQLVHGNIVPVFDMGEEDNEYFIAMEYIPGRDLREVTRRLAARGEAMPVDLALFIASEVCKGLDYAHRKTSEQGEPLGIVHRDVSPSNVLISREGEVKLIDFGIARAAGKLGKTVTGRIQGKFCYMSPEQASGKSVDGRSDIFSTAVVLYELLTGFRPFEGDSDLASLDLVRKCEFDPPSTLNPEVPEEVDAILATALEKEPEDRYRTIERFQIAILQYLYTAGTSPTSSELESFLGEVFPEGLEREELRSARDSGPSTPKNMSLDDALDFELQKLAGIGAPDQSVDPLETTAVSTADLLKKSESKTRTKVQRPSQGVEPADVEVEEVDELTDSASDASGGRRRWVASVAILAVLGGGIAVFGATQDSRGKVKVTSEPPGAQIYVDDALVPDAVTPYTLKLEEGEYNLKLELDGYEDKKINVDVKSGVTDELPARHTRLGKVQVPEGPRTFTIRALPETASIWVDDSEIGSGAGTTWRVKPDDIVAVTARQDGCRPMTKQISHGRGSDEVLFELNCNESLAADAGRDEEESRSAVKGQVSFSIKSQPDGAQISVNGRDLGSAPVKWSGEAEELVTIRAVKPGYATTQVRRRAHAFRRGLNLKLRPDAHGCLSARVENPFVAEFWVDGEKITRDMKLENHRLPVGEHTLRVKNDAAKLDHSMTVKIEEGSDCRIVSIDGRDL